MGHNCFYDIRIDFKGKSKQILLTYIAKWKNKSLDVIKVHESKKAFVRSNLVFIKNAGYFVVFPGEKQHYYYGNAIAEKFKYFEIEYQHRPNISNVQALDSDMKESIIRNRPELKYLVEKYKGGNIDILLSLINIYKSHPEVETLVEKDLIHIALDSRLWSLRKEKQREIIHFIMKNYNVCLNINLSNILFALKNNCTINEAIICSRNKCKLETVRYVEKQNESVSFYKDYILMAKELGKNLNDSYWLFPKSLGEAHNKVMDEVQRVREAKILARKMALEEQREKELKKYKINFEKMLKVNAKCNQLLDGFVFRLPIDEKDIINQAEALNQCLITSEYDKKYVNFQTVLIFVLKDNVRIATAEVTWKKKVKQFYCNEKDRRNCSPSNELRACFERYLSQINLKKPSTKISIID